MNNLILSVADNIDAMLAYWDSELVCRFANKAYIEWFGKRKEEMINKITLQELLGPLFEKNQSYISAALKGQKQIFEREIKTPNGTIRSSLATYIPHLEEGKVKGFFVHVADISTIKNLQRELLESLEKEKMLNELKSNFVSIASHEFRTPLTIILSSTSLIKKYRKMEEWDKTEKHLERIQATVYNLETILNNYLSLEKINQNKVEVHYESFNLPQYINQIKSEMSELLKTNQNIFYHHTGDEIINSEKRILQTILSNLISNAIKYSSKDINIQSETKNEIISISVQDHGIGISHEDQKNLFTSFFRAKNSQMNTAGSGLGLSISKRFVEYLAGNINIESELGIGTKVTFTLPFATTSVS